MLETNLFKDRILPPFPPYLIVALEISCAIAIGAVLVALGLGGAAWILGGIGAGALVFWLFTDSKTPNKTARKAGQTIVGLSIGLSLQRNDIGAIAANLPVFMGLPFCLILGGAAIGWVYSRLEKIDTFTALLATTPGNIGVMASIAADCSANAALVSLVQLMRFTSVILAAPLVANLAGIHPPRRSFLEFLEQLTSISGWDLVVSALMLAIAFAIAYWGGKLKIPMAAFLGAIALGLAGDNISLLVPVLPQIDLKLPLAFNIIGQILLGVTIGEYWAINPPARWETLGRAVVPVSLMFVAGGLTASVIKVLTSWDWLTCLLLAAPGGSPEMIWIALTLHQDPEIVTAAHVIRLLAINITVGIAVSVAYSRLKGEVSEVTAS